MRGNYTKVHDIGAGLRLARRAAGMAQETFEGARSFVSYVERGIKEPSLTKIQQIAGEMDVHPLTVLTLGYLEDPKVDSPNPLLSRVLAEIEEIRSALIAVQRGERAAYRGPNKPGRPRGRAAKRA